MKEFWLFVVVSAFIGLAFSADHFISPATPIVDRAGCLEAVKKCDAEATDRRDCNELVHETMGCTHPSLGPVQ